MARRESRRDTKFASVASVAQVEICELEQNIRMTPIGVEILRQCRQTSCHCIRLF